MNWLLVEIQKHSHGCRTEHLQRNVWGEERRGSSIQELHFPISTAAKEKGTIVRKCVKATVKLRFRTHHLEVDKHQTYRFHEPNSKSHDSKILILFSRKMRFSHPLWIGTHSGYSYLQSTPLRKNYPQERIWRGVTHFGCMIYLVSDIDSIQ